LLLAVQIDKEKAIAMSLAVETLEQSTFWGCHRGIHKLQNRVTARPIG
jgi:hypothetical protein